MKKLVLSAFLAVALFTSCKEDKSAEAENNNIVNNESLQTPFTMTVNAVVNKDADFQIYYNEDGSENYPPEQYVNVSIKGSEDFQDLTFVLPEDITPLNLRFDLGSTKDLNEVKFNNIKIDYRGKSIYVGKESIYRNFYPNTQVEFDTINAIAKIKVNDGEIYDPIIGATPELKKQLDLLYID